MVILLIIVITFFILAYAGEQAQWERGYKSYKEECDKLEAARKKGGR